MWCFSRMEVCVKTWDSLFCIKHKVYVKGVDAGFFEKSEVCIKAWDNTTHHPHLNLDWGYTPVLS